MAETNHESFSRSRRKADLNSKENRGGVGGGVNAVATPANSGALLSAATGTTSSSKKTGLVSFSQAGSAKCARKAVQPADMCVADSLDDQMLDNMCAINADLVDRNEWLAYHTLALFDHVNALCGTFSDVCTSVSCTIMTYPGTSKAYWMDERGKRHHYSAMHYIDSVMAFCEASAKNQAIFPTKFGSAFSPDFEGHCRRMARLLWHCCGHLYTKHWEHMATLNLRPHYGLVLAHMARVTKLYGLLDTKELLTLNNTLQLVRPSLSSGQQQRPTKRLNSCEGQEDSSNAPTKARQQQQYLQQQQQQAATAALRSLAMKSGSWGGHSAASATTTQTVSPLLSATAIKCYAQTC